VTILIRSGGDFPMFQSHYKSMSRIKEKKLVPTSKENIMYKFYVNSENIMQSIKIHIQSMQKYCN